MKETVRPYRAGWPPERVIEHIRSLSGVRFEPRVVEVFMQVCQERLAVVSPAYAREKVVP